MILKHFEHVFGIHIRVFFFDSEYLRIIQYLIGDLNQGVSSVRTNNDMFPAVVTLDSQNLHGEDSTVFL